MAKPGDELLNPHTGQSIRFVSIEPELLVMESSYKAGGAQAPGHFHPSQEEQFEVLSGAVLTSVDGDQQILSEGDRITIPAGTPHTFGGHPEQDATVRWEVRPALRTDGAVRAPVRHGRRIAHHAGGRLRTRSTSSPPSSSWRSSPSPGALSSDSHR